MSCSALSGGFIFFIANRLDHNDPPLRSNPQLGPVARNVDDFFTSYGREEKIDNAVTNVCGLKTAGVYTRVQAYLTWIDSVMAGAILAL